MGKKVKRTRWGIVSIIVAVVVVVGVSVFFVMKNINSGDGIENKILKVTKTYWSGWVDPKDSSYTPPKRKTFRYAISLGKEIELNRREGHGYNHEGQRYEVVDIFSIKLIEIGSDSVTIETSQPMSTTNKETGGISLMTNDKIFTITGTEELELVTPTMDAGDIYIFQLVDKGWFSFAK